MRRIPKRYQRDCHICEISLSDDDFFLCSSCYDNGFELLNKNPRGIKIMRPGTLVASNVAPRARRSIAFFQRLQAIAVQQKRDHEWIEEIVAACESSGILFVDHHWSEGTESCYLEFNEFKIRISDHCIPRTKDIAIELPTERSDEAVKQLLDFLR